LTISRFRFRVPFAIVLPETQLYFGCDCILCLTPFAESDISPYQHAEVLNDRSGEDARYSPAESATGHPAEAHYGSAIGQGWQDEDTALVENGR
jgi:hypothetical protein